VHEKGYQKWRNLLSRQNRKKFESCGQGGYKISRTHYEMARKQILCREISCTPYLRKRYLRTFWLVYFKMCDERLQTETVLFFRSFLQYQRRFSSLTASAQRSLLSSWTVSITSWINPFYVRHQIQYIFLERTWNNISYTA
jgi:hypothetical protein